MYVYAHTLYVHYSRIITYFILRILYWNDLNATMYELLQRLIELLSMWRNIKANGNIKSLIITPFHELILTSLVQTEPPLIYSPILTIAEVMIIHW